MSGVENVVERLGEYICRVESAGNPVYGESVIVGVFANEVIFNVDVFGSRVLNGIVGETDSALIVDADWNGGVKSKVHLIEACV